MLGTPHGQNPSLGSTIRHDRVGPTYPFGEADRPDFAVITTVVPSPPPAPRRRPPTSVALSTCGDTRSTGACSSNGARCTSAYVMTIRRSAISHDHLLRVGAVERCQRRDGRRPSDRLDDPPAGHIGQRGAVAWPSSASRARIRSGPAARCSPSATEYPTRAATLASPFSSRATGSTADPSPAAAAVAAAAPARAGSRGHRRRAGALVVDEAAAVLPADPPALVHLTALAS
jgi:hypothetical protein